MIDEEITFREKGYYSTNLKPKSNKEVLRVCDGCGDERWVMFCACTELCWKCAHKKLRKHNYDDHESIVRSIDKESIRERFGRVCFACQTTEKDNGRKLDVHHVNYDKECICNGKECEFVPLCIGCHSKTNGDRELWERLIINVLYYEGWID